MNVLLAGVEGLRELWLDGDLGEALGADERLDLRVDGAVDPLVLVHDVPGEHQRAGGEGPGVELVQREDPGELLQQILLQQRDLHVSWTKKNVIDFLSPLFRSISTNFLTIVE